MGHLMTDHFYMADAIAPKPDPVRPDLAVIIPVLAHEIRNAMVCVRELALAADVESDAAVRAQALASIARTTDFVMTLVSDGLRQAELLPGDETPRADVVAMRDLLADCLSIVTAEAARMGQTIAVHPGRSLPDTFEGDATRLRQIVTNLLRNAVRHSGSDRITLRVQLRRGKLSFAVRDWGKGLTAHEKRRLFRPFTQSDSIEAASRGSGLGLFICRRLARLLGGEIQLRSSPGSGSIFVLSVPFAKVRKDALHNHPAASSDGALPGRVLLVEDDPILGELIAIRLRREGCVVQWSRGLEDATEVLRGTEVDIVLCDHRIGSQLAFSDIGGAVASLPGARRPGLLAMSALVTAETCREAASSGFAEVLDKGAGVQALCKAVLAQLACRASRMAGS